MCVYTSGMPSFYWGSERWNPSVTDYFWWDSM